MKQNWSVHRMWRIMYSVLMISILCFVSSFFVSSLHSNKYKMLVHRIGATKTIQQQTTRIHFHIWPSDHRLHWLSKHVLHWCLANCSWLQLEITILYAIDKWESFSNSPSRLGGFSDFVCVWHPTAVIGGTLFLVQPNSAMTASKSQYTHRSTLSTWIIEWQ